jgi:hypothetical protein
MLTAIVIACGVLVVVLLVPFRLELQIGDPDVAQAVPRRKLQLTWAAGLISFDLGTRARSRAGSPAPTGAVGAKTRPSRRTRSAAARLLRLLRSEGFMAASATLLARLLRATHPRGLKVLVALGLDDPADTGQLWAVLGPVSAVLWSTSGGAVTIEPDFSQPRATIAARGRFALIPGQLIWILLSFALSPTLLRAARTASRR